MHAGGRGHWGGVIASVMLMACEPRCSWVEGPDLKYPGADKPQRMRSGGLSQTLQLLGNASSSWRSPRTRDDESGGGLVLWDALLIRYFSGSARYARQVGALAQCVHRSACMFGCEATFILQGQCKSRRGQACKARRHINATMAAAGGVCFILLMLRSRDKVTR